ncbi:cellulose biosynthesis cyclic di-GMP-binding regulatory protein BcsB [Paraburkholderia mimosarum]|uniref:cellulose biosynthesis cyclic di-GMP-binding regulatory protein BcsB n=1 Tax=Paraburkholderia mimosarum TaxID=312026 RepID=UPI00041A63C5|nr:cellulose biosynthesis cyclic di-GMP-binding regulatory protein BcsB [Paraburkholderia mimosarum]
MVNRLVRLAVACLLGLVALSADAQTVTRPFSSLRSRGGAAAAAHALIVELSPREALSGVHLQLASDVAPEDGTRYAIWVNGALVADVDAKGAVQTIALSPQAFVPGTNSVQLARVPHSATITGQTAYSDTAPINDARSSISLDFAGLRPNPAPTLAQLPLAFDARAWMPRNVTVVLGRQSPSPGQLRAAALTVESIAARMRQVDVTVAYQGDKAIIKRDDPGSWGIDRDTARAGDVLLVGTRSALADALPPAVADAINRPFLGVYPANEGRSVIVVVSGITETDCLRAAQAFADASTMFPARANMTPDAAMAIHVPPAQLVISLGHPDAALVRAALNFAAIHVRTTGLLAEVTFTYSADITNTDFFFGPATSLDARVLRQLPVFPPLQPGQAVSLTGNRGAHRFVAVLGDNETSVARTIDMLRQPTKGFLLAQGATLFDTTTGSAKPLALAERSGIARLRLLLADPIVFWCVLTTLLALSYIFLNMTLKDQVKKRFDQSSYSDPSPK